MTKKKAKRGRKSLGDGGNTDWWFKFRAAKKDRQLFTRAVEAVDAQREALGDKPLGLSEWARRTLRRSARRILRDLNR